MGRRREKWPSTSPGEGPQKKPTLPTSWSQMPRLQNCEEAHFYCQSHPVSSTLLWQSWESNSAARRVKQGGPVKWVTCIFGKVVKLKSSLILLPLSFAYLEIDFLSLNCCDSPVLYWSSFCRLNGPSVRSGWKIQRVTSEGWNGLWSTEERSCPRRAAAGGGHHAPLSGGKTTSALTSYTLC